MADVQKTVHQEKFTSIPLDAGKSENRKKVPKRVLHFSDGVIEEYSSDEEDSVDCKPVTVVDPKSLTWIPWCAHYAKTAAMMSLTVAELCGEKLAWLFGITSPKYGYAIEEYKRIAKEAEEEKQRVEKLKEQANVNSAFDVKVVGGEETSPVQPSAEDMEAANKY